MPPMRQFVVASVLAAVCCVVGLGRVPGAEIDLADDAPQPLPPGESVKLFQLPPGFRVELAACEPYVEDPVAMAFDSRGRIIVCEIHGYNLEGYLDVVELNASGVLDEQVRRIDANDKAVKQAAREQYGTVKLLEDTDGDGRVDRASVLADRLPACYGALPVRDGVIVLCAPDILLLADRDGDGKAEVREKLFTGFGVGPLWSRINNPRWSVDNWIYGVCGIGSGGTIRGPRLEEEVQLGSVCFRFKPDGTALEPVSGKTSGFGQAINDWGDRFLVTNQQHALLVAPLPHRYLVRNPYYAAPNPVINVCSYGHPAPVYPTSRPHPWRLARSEQPEWVKFYGAAEATANGYFTAASGPTIYRADQFPRAYRGNHFSVDNAQNMIHRCILNPAGAGYVADRATLEEKEFLTSTESWFRPVNTAVGPDGALYVVDMYRSIIEDYSAIPRYLQQLYVKSLIDGAQRGRIWRITADGASKAQPLDLSVMPTDDLVGRLSGGNAWWRQTAQRLLVQRGDNRAVGLLAELLDAGATPQARLHALYTLDGLGALSADHLSRALADPHFAVRLHAVCLAEPRLDRHDGLRKEVFGLVDDPHPRVRLQVAFTLGESQDAAATTALAHLASRYAGDPWVRAAVLSSAVDSADRLIAAVLRQSETVAQGRMLLRPLASVVGARRQDDQVARLLESVAAAAKMPGVSMPALCLEGLIEGLERGQPKRLDSAAGRSALEELVSADSPRMKALAFRVAGLLKLADLPEIQRSLANAKRAALDESLSVEVRTAALDTLAAAPLAVRASVSGELLDPRQPLALQLAAVESLASADDAGVAAALLSGWEAYTPKVKEAVIEALFSRKSRLGTLLDAVQSGTVLPSSLDSLRRLQLVENSDADISRRANALLKGANLQSARHAVLDRYRVALDMPRDAARGKEVFDGECAKCHKLKGQGYEVGPDLAAANNRADETLLSDILDPNRQITAGYHNYTVVTESGLIFTGVLSAETATSVTLRKEESAEQTILRKNIDEMAASTLSMMPEELEKTVTEQNVADLLGYLREALGPVAPHTVVLFEDEEAILEQLDQGEGIARLVARQAFSGTASLAVTPPQRFSAQIPGWHYPIREKPGPGELRYLRLAWRSRDGQGVMIELAADGNWPPAEKAERRYYAGKNTTQWQAVQVARRAPRNWTVVTRDLWKDFGDFTLTGIAPTAMGGVALFDRIELLRSLDSAEERE